MYIPLSIPPTQLPQYVHLDRSSRWHTSALLSAALESVTLPTRLRHDTQKHRLVDFETALNVNGNQRIAQLQCSMLDSENAPLAIAITHGSTDDRTPSGNNRTLVDGLKLTEPSFDMDLSNCDPRSTTPFTNQHDSPDHVFGAVTITRTQFGAARDEEVDEDEITYARKRRRIAGLPVIERFAAPTLSKILPLRRILFYATDCVQVPILA